MSTLKYRIFSKKFTIFKKSAIFTALIFCFFSISLIFPLSVLAQKQNDKTNFIGNTNKTLPLSSNLSQTTTPIAEQQNNISREVNIYFFWGEGCPHCAKEEIFLEKLTKKYPQIKMRDFEVSKNKDNRQLLNEISKKLNANVAGVPFTVVGERYFSGWYDEASTGASIEEAVQCVLQNKCRDIIQDIVIANDKNKNIKETGDYSKEKNILPQKITLPIFGEIEIKNFSLPILTIIFGALDGFNPCAMWTLLFLISLLLGMKNKKRMWILGTAFIIASASVYFLFMTAWLNLLLFIGFVVWIRIIIGLIALAGGGYNLKEYFTDPGAKCKVVGTEKKKKTFKKLKTITQQPNFYLALVGIIVLAFAVNLVELICSAGLPTVFTQILTLSNLDRWQYYLYILIYIFFFMLDDLLIFLVAMITLKITGLTAKYSRWSRLLGGILMLIIGLLLIFKPQWLMFG